MHEGVVDAIRAAGGEIYGITSEPQHLADQAREHWELGFETVGDPHQEISQTCNERGWLTLFTNTSNIEFIQRGADWKVEHPKGFFQPGVLALTSGGRVLYRWRSVPSAENLNGTLARPTAAHAWRGIEAALAAGDGAGDAAHDDDPVVDQKAPPRALFIAMLLANGWFVRVKSFAYAPGVGSVPSRFGRAGLRWIPFVAAWVLAARWLPALPVALAFLAWAAWVVRDVRRMFGARDERPELAAGS